MKCFADRFRQLHWCCRQGLLPCQLPRPRRIRQHLSSPPNSCYMWVFFISSHFCFGLFLRSSFIDTRSDLQRLNPVPIYVKIHCIVRNHSLVCKCLEKVWKPFSTSRRSTLETGKDRGRDGNRTSDPCPIRQHHLSLLFKTTWPRLLCHPFYLRYVWSAWTCQVLTVPPHSRCWGSLFLGSKIEQKREMFFYCSKRGDLYYEIRFRRSNLRLALLWLE